MYFWPRGDRSIPLEIASGDAQSIDLDDYLRDGGGAPERWGTPQAFFPASSSCDFNAHFSPHNLVINLSFCVSYSSENLPNPHYILWCWLFYHRDRGQAPDSTPLGVVLEHAKTVRKTYWLFTKNVGLTLEQLWEITQVRSQMLTGRSIPCGFIHVEYVVETDIMTKQ